MLAGYLSTNLEFSLFVFLLRDFPKKRGKEEKFAAALFTG